MPSPTAPAPGSTCRPRPRRSGARAGTVSLRAINQSAAQRQKAGHHCQCDEEHATARDPADSLPRPRAHFALNKLLAAAHLAVGLDERGDAAHQKIVERLTFGAAARFQLIELFRLAAIAFGVGMGIPV